MKTYILENEIPEFLDAMALVKTGRGDCICTNIGSFKNEPDLFYQAMKLAAENGVEVRLIPDTLSEATN
jgi:hypothetical protein